MVTTSCIDQTSEIIQKWKMLFLLLDIINSTLERVGVSNEYISHGQSLSYKVSFEIELGPLNFNMVSKLGYPLQLPIVQLLHTML